MTSLSNRGKRVNGKDKSIHRSVALMSHKTTQFVTLIWNIPRSVILLTNNFSKEKFGKLYIVWIDNTFHFWIAFSLTLLMRFYLCFITVVLKLVLLLMSSSSLPLIIPHPKKSNLFLNYQFFIAPVSSSSWVGQCPSISTQILVLMTKQATPPHRKLKRRGHTPEEGTNRWTGLYTETMLVKLVSFELRSATRQWDKIA